MISIKNARKIETLQNLLPRSQRGNIGLKFILKESLMKIKSNPKNDSPILDCCFDTHVERGLCYPHSSFVWNVEFLKMSRICLKIQFFNDFVFAGVKLRNLRQLKDSMLDTTAWAKRFWVDS